MHISLLVDKLPFLYTVLFTLSLVLINPWGEALDFGESGRAEIWTYPKVAVLVLISVVNIWILVDKIRKRDDSINFSRLLKIASVLWLAYLLSALISTLLSPFPWHSLFGQSVLGDGLLYWVLIAIFVLSNALVLEIYPRLFKSQIHGVLLGGLILALSIFPQVLDWRIDYTATSGQVSSFNPELLESYVWRNQMPIGLYTNRGFAAYVLASVACLSLVCIIREVLSKNLELGVFLITVGALLFTQSRAAIFSLIITGLYFLFRYSRQADQLFLISRKTVLSLLITSIVLLGFQIYKIHTSFQPSDLTALDFSDTLEVSLTGRLYLWETSIRGILERPIWGWGFNGFGIAHLFIGDWQNQLHAYISEDTTVSQIVALYETTFDYISTDGELYSGVVLTHKGHNLILDVLLSVGVVGLICYSLLIGFFMWHLLNSSFFGYEAVAILYLTFTLTWYETAQVSHLFWWVLSFACVQSEQQQRSTF
jgi:O-antigen ligase